MNGRVISVWSIGGLAGRGDDRGAALMTALMLATVLAFLGAAAITTTTMETQSSAHHRASIQAFYAAEMGIHTGLQQLSADPDAATQAILKTPLDGSGHYQYQSGRRYDTSPQPFDFLGSRPWKGFSMGSGTGYNPSGYVFYAYQMHSTGRGPRHAQREIELEAAYGPINQ